MTHLHRVTCPFHSASDLLGDIVDRLTRAPRVQAKHGVTMWLGLVDVVYPSDKNEQGKLARLTRPCNIQSDQFSSGIHYCMVHLQFISIHSTYKI